MSHNKMQGRSNRSKGTGGCRALCCTDCRTSIEGGESSRSSDRYASISTISHFMVQERLNQMIKESEEDQARKLTEARKRKQKQVVKKATTSSSSNSNNNNNNRRLHLMLAMETSSHNPREDFRRSMVEVILANRIKDPKDLRYILKCYTSMNSVEYRGIILEVFYQVCTDIFFCCKCHWWDDIVHINNFSFQPPKLCKIWKTVFLNEELYFLIYC